MRAGQARETGADHHDRRVFVARVACREARATEGSRAKERATTDVTRRGRGDV
jgi:hypothetical protein